MKMRLITLAALAFALTPAIALASPAPQTGGHNHGTTTHDRSTHVHDRSTEAHH